jgi:hypothetical protein
MSPLIVRHASIVEDIKLRNRPMQRAFVIVMLFVSSTGTNGSVSLSRDELLFASCKTDRGETDKQADGSSIASFGLE